MAAITTRETKSMRESAVIENKEICSISSNYGERSISVNIIVQDADAVKKNADEVQAFISAFIRRFNGVLAEDGQSIAFRE